MVGVQHEYVGGRGQDGQRRQEQQEKKDTAHHVHRVSGRPKMAICCISEKIQTAYLCMTARPGCFRFLASYHFGTGCEF